MRGETLLQTARSLEATATRCAATAEATDYGITPARVTALKKEADGYESLIAATDHAISGRAAVTRALRGSFADLEARLEELDDLILPLRATTAGALFQAKFEQARAINDSGHGPRSEEQTSPASPLPTS